MSLDDYITGGDPHNVETVAVCGKVECPEYGVEYEVTVRVEYGGGEAPECSECYTYMETDDYELRSISESVQRANELEKRMLSHLKQGYLPFDVPFSD